MSKKILIISGSPKKDGNTDQLIRWFREGAEMQGAEITVANAASLKLKANGCTSCRMCQTKSEYGCVIKDEASDVIMQMIDADVVVFATPLYFFSASAQIKAVLDRMFSLYKWDNAKNSMETVLKGKTLVLIASAYENVGLACLAEPFRLTAEYSGMKFESLLVPDAGVSGSVGKAVNSRKNAVDLGNKVAIA
jgi:multimeric flavodoxin WrbA